MEATGSGPTGEAAEPNDRLARLDQTSPDTIAPDSKRAPETPDTESLHRSTRAQERRYPLVTSRPQMQPHGYPPPRGIRARQRRRRPRPPLSDAADLAARITDPRQSAWHPSEPHPPLATATTTSTATVSAVPITN